MFRMNPSFWLLGALCALPLLSPGDAHAIAAFARQYKTPCNTCHDPFPHRTEFGETFRRNGYVWPGQAKEPVTQSLVEVFNVAGILDDVPLSISALTQFSYDTGREKDHFQSPTDFQLHLGGSLKNTLGFFAHDITSNSEAVVVWRNLLDSPLYVRYGKLIPQTTLWEPNQTFTTLMLAPLKLQVGSEPALGVPRDALELNAVMFERIFLAGGVADRSNQNAMDYYVHAAYKLGGGDFHGTEPEIDFDNESLWDYLSLTFAGYGYFGRTDETGDRFWRAGAEVEARYKQLNLLFSEMQARNKDPLGTSLSVDTLTWLVEADYYVNTDFTLSARYEQEHVGNDTAGTRRRVIGAVNWVPIQSFLLRLEGNWERTQDPDNSVDIGTMLTAEIHI